MSSQTEGVATQRQPVAQARPVDSSEGMAPRQAASAAAAGAPAAVQAIPVKNGGGIPSSQEMAMSAAAAAAGGAGMLPALHPAAGLGPMMMGGLSSDQLNVLCMQAAVAAMQVHGNPGWPLPGMPGVPSQVGWPKGFDPANPLGAPVRTFLHHLSRPIWAGLSTPALLAVGHWARASGSHVLLWVRSGYSGTSRCRRRRGRRCRNGRPGPSRRSRVGFGLAEPSEWPAARTAAEGPRDDGRGAQGPEEGNQPPGR